MDSSSARTLPPSNPYTRGMSSAILQTSVEAAPCEPVSELLFPLSLFCSPRLPPRACEVETAETGAMPQPYRQLLVHERDMTSTLERFHGESLFLRPVERRREGEHLLRRVILMGSESGRPREFGAIRIDLAAFEPAAREEILASRRPLGAILALFEVPYTSRPRRFFRLESAAWLNELFHLESSRALYGRQNILATPSGRSLAEVVEILPPAREPM